MRKNFYTDKYKDQEPPLRTHYFMNQGIMEFSIRKLKKELKEGENIKDQKTLSEGGVLESENPDTYVSGGGKDSDDLYDRIEFIEETANSEGRDLTNAEKADIASIKKRIKNL